MNWVKWMILSFVAGAAFFVHAERINQEGRILGTAPVVTNSILFNTPEGDAVVSAMQIFPVTSAWNEDVSRRPILSNSDLMIAQIMSDLASNRRNLRVFQEMNFVLAADNQPPIPIQFVTYASQSDPSPYPIPANMPIETWPSQTGSLTLQQWQQDVNNTGGDRHSIVVQPGAGFTWETWQAKLVGGNWQAANGARFDLKSNALRPNDWTSGDAAGLSMFPALVRYDECERGMVEHACRIVVGRSRMEHIYPATHWASSTPATQTNVPAMGQRVRLKSGFVIPGGWAKEEQALLLGLKKYGALVADNGNFFSISITPDDRWPANAFSHITSIGITNFEVVQSTGATEGPRSAGAPSASAGPDQSILPGTVAALAGFVAFTGSAPVMQWTKYAGPGTVTFGNSAQTNTTSTFSGPGIYTLRLSADDGVHAVAYDAVVITVQYPLQLSIVRAGANAQLTWSGGLSPYEIDQIPIISSSNWTAIFTSIIQSALIPATGTAGYFRVRSLGGN